MNKEIKMSSSKKLDELTELVMLLQLNEIKGVTIDEMCERLERPRRAIERMMEVLKDKFGGKLTYKIGEYDRKKHWSLKKGSMSFMINFSDSEIANLEMLKNKVINVEEKKIISNIIDKIRVLNRLITKFGEFSFFLKINNRSFKLVFFAKTSDSHIVHSFTLHIIIQNIKSLIIICSV